MSRRRLAQFEADIARARDLVGLGQSIVGLTHGRVDSTDLYRSALVQAIAALDSYIRGVVLDRAVDLLTGRLQVSSAPGRVGLPFDAVNELLNAQTEAERELLCLQRISARLSLETYQQPDDIAKALAMVGVTKIWSSAFGSAEDAKRAVKVIVTRRNNIVHACDVDPVQPGSVTPLSAQDALDAVGVVEITVQAISAYC
jgi:hypothetical protein